MSTLPVGPPPEENKRLPFDEAAIAEMAEAAKLTLAAHPEIRSVVVAFDYRDQFSTAKVKKILWLGENGNVTAPDAVIGSMQVTLLAARFMLERADKLGESLLRQLIDAGQQLVEKQKALLKIVEPTDDQKPG
jgi:hypothetical protein